MRSVRPQLEIETFLYDFLNDFGCGYDSVTSWKQKKEEKEIVKRKHFNIYKQDINTRNTL